MIPTFEQFEFGIYERRLRRKLLDYGNALGPYCTYNDLLALLQTLPVPCFKSDSDRADFISRILADVANTLIHQQLEHQVSESEKTVKVPRPPLNAEYILYLLLRKSEREEIIGDLIESYGHLVKRFDKRHADIWFYKQVLGSLLPLLRRQILRIGALVWLGRVLRRLIS
jgi:hypothetical protein